MAKMKILDLRPTQFAVGMKEVETKVEKLKVLSGDALHDYLRDHPVPVVLSPDGGAYLTDHHHLVRAAWEADLHDVATKVMADLTHLTPGTFWGRMEKEGWTYLHDQFGKGPHSPELLPLDVRGLADDPFRSLAWALREKKGFNKSPVPFCEFRWSEFLRRHITGHPMKMGFHKALEEALKLCHRPEAKSLPGYIDHED